MDPADALVAALAAHHGTPVRLDWSGELTDAERRLIAETVPPERRHDVTLFVFNGPRLALIRKPFFPRGVWRAPGGGIQPGESAVAGIRREAHEELGVEIELGRYLVDVHATFRHRGEEIHWRTHVFRAATDAEELRPTDVAEIEAARWSTAAELAGPIRATLAASGQPLLAYRVAVHDAALAALDLAAAA